MYQRAKEDEKRVLTCDRQIIDALEEPGFAIADDKDSATVAGEMKIDIIQPAESKEFFLRITLPTGEKLDLGIRRRVLVDAVEDAARSICARRPEAVAGVFLRCVVAPRSRDDEQAAQRAGSQERPGGAGADRGAGHRAGKAKTEKEAPIFVIMVLVSLTLAWRVLEAIRIAYARSTVSVILSSKTILERCAAFWMLSVVLVVIFSSISMSYSAARARSIASSLRSRLAAFCPASALFLACHHERTPKNTVPTTPSIPAASCQSIMMSPYPWRATIAARGAAMGTAIRFASTMLRPAMRWLRDAADDSAISENVEVIVIPLAGGTTSGCALEINCWTM
jgi:hypothetical protein